MTTDPMGDDLCFTQAVELLAGLRARELSPVELTQALLDRVERVNPKVNAFVTLRREEALAEARHAEEALMHGDPDTLGALFGLPVTVKDLTSTAGVRTTFGHPAFKDHIPNEDGVIWARMKAAGAILLGKTATPPFGEHSITRSEVHGETNNPWDLSRTVGGSSGGAAAASAAGISPLATGSDGGGSIRVPSSLCGVVGLKASVGRIPFRGDGSAFETVAVVGPITRTVADNALLLDVVAGPDPFSLFSLPAPETGFLAATIDPSVAGARIAYSPDLGDGPVEPAVRETVAQAAEAFERDLGARVEVVEVDLPDPLDYFLNWWGPQLAYSVDDLKETMGIESDPLHAEILAHSRAMSAPDYARVILEDRERLHRVFAEVFLEHEFLIWPTTPMVAFPHPGPEGGPAEVAGVAVRHPPLQNQRYTEAIAHAGYPAITVPAGWTAGGLPVGVQIAGRHGADADVLRAAAAFETVRPWCDRRPAL